MKIRFFFFLLYLCFHPLSPSWFVTVLSWCLFSVNLPLTLVLVGRAWPVSGHMARSWPEAGLTCHFLPAGADGVCLWIPSTPLRTGRDKDFGRLAGGPRSERLGDGEVWKGGGRGLSWRSTGFRTGCMEQAAAAAAQAERTLAATSADQ